MKIQDIEGEKTCPKCGHVGQIDEDFGYREIGESIRPQSYCRRCRGQKQKKVDVAASVSNAVKISEKMLAKAARKERVEAEIRAEVADDSKLMTTGFVSGSIQTGRLTGRRSRRQPGQGSVEKEGPVTGTTVVQR